MTAQICKCRTKGGYIFDVKVTYEERETSHRVIVGKEYYEDFEIQPEQVLDRAFAYLLGKKIQRQTEGMALFRQRVLHKTVPMSRTTGVWERRKI